MLEKLFGIDVDILKHYQYILIPKKNGGFREIYNPDPKLRRAQEYILRTYLYPNFKAHPAAFAYKKGVSIKHMVMCHMKAKTVITLDIKDFFPSITDHMIRKELENKIRNYELVKSITHLTTIPKWRGYIMYRVVPQGALTSPALSNIVMYTRDDILYKLLKKNGLLYTRYSDDIVISSRRKMSERRAEWVIETVEKVLKPFELNRKKTKIYRHKKQILGINIADGKLSVPREYRRELRSELYHIYKNVQDGAPVPEVYLQSLKGKIKFIKYINPDQARWFEKMYQKIIS